MKFDDNKILSEYNKQRELLLSGNFNTLFNDLKLNLPHRFFAYAKPKTLNNSFNNTFNKLESYKKSINKNDTWAFDDIIRLISSSHKYEKPINALKFLVNKCKIPENHLYLKKEPFKNELFENKKIYLSRYAMCLLTNNILKESAFFKQDIESELFSKSTQNTKHNFENEMQTAFAGYYFSHPKTDCSDLTKTTWDWVRGKKLKLAYDSALKDLEGIVKGVMGKQFTYHKFEEFKQNFIFDILFKEPGFGTFKQQYEAALESFGYTLDSYKNDELKWHKGNKIAPKYPGGFFAPQITFLLAWSINKFCEFEKSEFNHKIKNRNDWLNNLTEKFFSAVKEGINSEKYKHRKTEYNFDTSIIFTNKHHSDANRTINSIKHGTGRKIIDKKSGEKIHKSPSALEFWKTKHLFDSDDMLCLTIRQDTETKLEQLYNEYSQTPSSDLAKIIYEKEKIITNECKNLYRINFQAFVNPPHILGLDGKLITRPMINNKIPDKPPYLIKPIFISKEIYTVPKKLSSKQYCIDFNNPVNHYIKSMSLDNIKLSNFRIILNKNVKDIPQGMPVSCDSWTDKKGILQNDWYLNSNGIFETINPLIQNPTDFREKNGSELPKLIKENFQMHNFVFESDTLPIAQQIKFAQQLITLKVINRVVFSGNKSLHMKITVQDTPKTLDEYKWLFFYLGVRFGLVNRNWDNKNLRFKYNGCIDLSMSNNNRSTRRPGGIRIIKNKDKNDKTIVQKVEQKLLHQTNTVYDIDWRPVFNEENHWIKNQKKLYAKSVPYNYSENKDINKFMQNYANKNLISLSFDHGNGHNTGNCLIGAAGTAGFSDNEIISWLKYNCERYDELKSGWRGLLKTAKQY